MIQYAPRDRENALRSLSRQAVLVAAGEIGHGEIGENNAGPHVDRYRNGKGGRGSWCAHFVSWCYEEACRRRSLMPLWPHEAGAKKLARSIAEIGGWVDVEAGDVPLPGDVICWHRRPWGSWHGHIAFVDAYGLDADRLTVIDGNHGSFPAAVDRRDINRGMWRAHLYGVARIWAAG